MAFNSKQEVIKLIAFVLMCLTFILSLFVYKLTYGLAPLLGAVIGGFFGYYLAAFIGLVTGNEIDKEVGKSWAIYGACSLFGLGLKLLIGYNSNDDNGVFVLVTGILSIATAVCCFLDGMFAE